MVTSYEELIEQALSHDFIPDRETADAAVKATLGIMVSRMESDEDAREFTRFLPEPLTFDKLRSHQDRPTNVNPDQYLDVIANQFKLGREQSEELVKGLLHKVKENLGEGDFVFWDTRLPKQWTRLIEQA